MRISQLSNATGVPVATIKYYLRERLLHDGQLTSATQATYDDSHVRRLQLIRALLGPGGLTVAAAGDVLRSIDSPPASRHDLLGVAHQAVHRPVPPEVDLGEVHALMQHWGWEVHDKDCDTQVALAHALHGLAVAGFEPPEGALDMYAELMRQIADVEIANVPTDPPEAAVRYVILGTVLMEPVLLALRRLAEQDASRRRFGPAPPSP